VNNRYKTDTRFGLLITPELQVRSSLVPKI